MLETKNLKKVYKTKKGVSVNALNGVSIKFTEKGPVSYTHLLCLQKILN